MSSPRRISPRTAHKELAWDQALLVCAYDSAEKFEQNHLQGATSLDDFKAQLPNLSKDRDIVFY
jgi:hypothetical protein